MSVLGALVRGSLESPNTPLSAAHVAEWAQGATSDAGVPVTERRVYGLPAYYRGIAIKAGTLAGLPIKPYRVGTREHVTQRTVLDGPNPRQTPFEWWFTTYANAISWGSGFGLKIHAPATSAVVEVWPIHPSRVDVHDWKVTPETPDGKVFDVTWPDGSQSRLSSWDVLHVPYLSLDGVTGLRPLELFRQSLGIAIAAEQTSAKFYGSGSMISGVLTTEQPLDDVQATALKRRWKAKVAGPQRAGDVAVLDRGAKFEAVSIPPGDAQLLESRRWSVDEIARMVGLPPHLIGAVDRSTSWGTGIEQQALGWVKFDLQSWISLVEQRVTRELLPGGWHGGRWFAEISVEGLLRGDSKSRAEFYRVMTALGAISPAEVRNRENLEPVDGLDFYTIPKNLQVIAGPDTAGQAPAPAGGDDQAGDQAGDNAGESDPAEGGDDR